MANINPYLERILQAVYGEEVRGSIHDALAAMNEESSAAMEYAATAQDSARASASSAASSASTATQKANAASTSATNAANSASTASQKASAAATSEANAKASETQAKSSETNAATSAATATQKAAAASASETAAKASETAAKASETNAAAAETVATQKASDAATSEANASASATTATQKAADATASEANAKASERAAAESASSAFQNGELARVSATSAKVSEENASAAEISARESAASAQESATSAEFFSGKPPIPYNGTWWIWDMEAYEALHDNVDEPVQDNSEENAEVMEPGYVDTGISCELEGPQGVGIDDIQHTSGTHSPGTSDIYTIFLSNGSTYTISVWNGRNGEGAGDVLGKEFDLVIPSNGWNNKTATIADNRFVAQSNYKYFLIADEASRTEFLNCKVQPQNITTDGFISFTCETVPTHDLTVNITRLELSGNS